MSSPILRAVLARLETPTRSQAIFEKPQATEHGPYYTRYIDKVPPGDFCAMLRRQAAQVAELFGALTSAQADFSYGPGKWTVKEVLGHLIDTERVFTYRATSIGRSDPNPLPGFDQDQWMAPADFGARGLEDLLAEWLVVRAATLALVEGFPADAPLRHGVASDLGLSVRAALFIPPGHVEYHLEILRERYFNAPSWPR
jgi:hypothetical protein